jgi:hypothetical protein
MRKLQKQFEVAISHDEIVKMTIYTIRRVANRILLIVDWDQLAKHGSGRNRFGSPLVMFKWQRIVQFRSARPRSHCRLQASLVTSYMAVTFSFSAISLPVGV